jgi:hypothetical protein
MGLHQIGAAVRHKNNSSAKGRIVMLSDNEPDEVHIRWESDAGETVCQCCRREWLLPVGEGGEEHEKGARTL